MKQKIKLWLSVASAVAALALLVSQGYGADLKVPLGDAAQAGAGDRPGGGVWHTPLVLGASEDLRGKPLEHQPLLPLRQPDFGAVAAESFLVYDPLTGQIFAERSPELALGIASVTKLATALVAYDRLTLSEEVTVPYGLPETPAPNLGLIPGDRVKAEDLIAAMVVGSCNDAALVLAGAVSEKTGEPFVALMNQTAASLGMDGTAFVNPTGFTAPGSYSTAADVRKLVDQTQSLSLFTGLGRKTEYRLTGQSGRTYRAVATNRLLKSHPELEAVKTGYTEASGGSMVTRANLGGRRLTVIVLSSPEREADTLALIAEIKHSYGW